MEWKTGHRSISDLEKNGFVYANYIDSSPAPVEAMSKSPVPSTPFKEADLGAEPEPTESHSISKAPGPSF